MSLLKRKTQLILLLALVLLISLLGCNRARDHPIDDGNPINNGTLEPGDYTYELTHENTNRFYLLHVPPSYSSASGPVPLVLAFHGGLGTAQNMADNYGWIEKSDAEGFLVAFPNGISRLPTHQGTWNAGNCCGYAAENNIDDVGFVQKIVNNVKSNANIGKVFAVGMSNGAMFSYRLACDLPEMVHAIGAVSGTDNYDECASSKPISIMHVHSLLDQHVLYEGGCGPDCSTDVEYTSVPETISRWVERNRCGPTPLRVFENENAYCDLYNACLDNVKINVCITQDGGHAWPGRPQSPNPLEKTTPSQALSATDEIWAFFESLI